MNKGGTYQSGSLTKKRIKKALPDYTIDNQNNQLRYGASSFSLTGAKSRGTPSAYRQNGVPNPLLN